MTLEVPEGVQAQQRDPTQNTEPASRSSVPSVGRRLAFQDLKRQLTTEELSESGAQKLILELLASAEAERDEFKAYVPLYYEADKKVSTLSEKLHGDRLNEAMFSVGISVGSAAIGLSPIFWDERNARGPLCLAVGAVLVVGFTIARVVRVRQK
jgi:hypothetical protein